MSGSVTLLNRPGMKLFGAQKIHQLAYSTNICCIRSKTGILYFCSQSGLFIPKKLAVHLPNVSHHTNQLNCRHQQNSARLLQNRSSTDFDGDSLPRPMVGAHRP